MANPAEVQICNVGLARVGSTAFISTLNDASEEGRISKLHYETKRNMLLAYGPWSFATRRQTLQALSDVTAPEEWGYIYKLPTDCIGPHFIEDGLQNRNPNLAIPFRVEDRADVGRVVLTMTEPAVLVYSFKQKDVAAYSEEFRSALGWSLAHEFALALNKRADIAQFAWNAYIYERDLALATDMNHHRRDGNYESEFISVRN